MNIVLTPQRCNRSLDIEKEGDVLWINGIRYSFANPVAEINGEFFTPGSDLYLAAFDHPTMTVTLINPLPTDASEVQKAITTLTSVFDGLVTLPNGLRPRQKAPPVR